MKRAVFMTILIIISASLTGCGEADMEGIVLDVTENKLLLSENLTPKEYEGIKDESVIKIQNEDVEGERESLHLIELTYDQADKFSKGDEVEDRRGYFCILSWTSGSKENFKQEEIVI